MRWSPSTINPPILGAARSLYVSETAKLAQSVVFALRIAGAQKFATVFVLHQRITASSLIAFRLAKNYEGGFVLMLQPEFFSKLHLNVLEAEGLLFNVLLFLRFCASEVKSLIRLFRRRAKHP